MLKVSNDVFQRHTDLYTSKGLSRQSTLNHRLEVSERAEFDLPIANVNRPVMQAADNGVQVTHLDKSINLSCVWGKILGLSLSKSALRCYIITSDDQGGKLGQLFCQHDCTLAHGLQHVQKTIGARRGHDCWAQLQD